VCSSISTTPVTSPVCTVTVPSVTTTSVVTSTQITSLPSTQVLLQSILQPLPGDVQSCAAISMAHPTEQLKTIDSVEAHCVSALVNLKLDEQFKVLTKLFCGLM